MNTSKTPQPVTAVPPLNEHFSVVTIRADDVVTNGDGTWRIVIPSRHMTSDERRTLETLFPNMLDSAYRLLSRENLLGSIVE